MIENTLDDTFLEKLDKAKKLLIEKVDPFTIYLIGSAAKNNLHAESDIDIAFLKDKKIGAYKCFELASDLADIFNRDVDLIELNTSSTVFKVQAIANGRVIYDIDENKRMQFEMCTFKAYAMLNEGRQEILNHIKESGKVYE